jgi:hypothetical protein
MPNSIHPRHLTLQCSVLLRCSPWSAVLWRMWYCSLSAALSTQRAWPGSATQCYRDTLYVQQEYLVLGTTCDSAAQLQRVFHVFERRRFVHCSQSNARDFPSFLPPPANTHTCLAAGRDLWWTRRARLPCWHPSRASLPSWPPSPAYVTSRLITGRFRLIFICLNNSALLPSIHCLDIFINIETQEEIRRRYDEACDTLTQHVITVKHGPLVCLSAFLSSGLPIDVI